MHLLLTLIVGLFFLVGIFVSKVIKKKDSLCNFSVGLALIVLLGVIIFDLIPELREIYDINKIFTWHNLILLVVILLGIVILKLFDYFIPDHHHDHHDNEKNKLEHNNHLYHIGFVTLIAILIHNVIEGMAIYLVSLQDFKTGIIMALGVSLHNIPLGIEISATMLEEKKNKRNLILLVLLTLSSLIGGLIVILFGEIQEIYLGYIIALSLGMSIYLALFELLPEMITHLKKKSTMMGILTGIIIVIISLFL
ncbi:MAG: ZIP family metal transporter [Bacilli bacterium]|nr:ZIP family metal transporter [Bacilli bacterium]